MKIAFLGTNGWYSSYNNTICTLIDTESHYIVLDAGDGLWRLEKYIEEDKPIILFLSHTHLDHIIGLHILSKFRYYQGITIYGFKGTKISLNNIFDHPYSTVLSHLPYKIEIKEVQEGTHKIPIPFTVKLLVHSDVCVGYRFELENKLITYCTDTGVCENLTLLSSDADVLISECSYKPGQEKWGWPHLKPEEIALIAKNGNVKQLLLTHFDASLFESVNDRYRIMKVVETIFPQTSVTYDGLELIV